jgi:hypothetical protein
MTVQGAARDHQFPSNLGGGLKSQLFLKLLSINSTVFWTIRIFLIPIELKDMEQEYIYYKVHHQVLCMCEN